MITLENIFLQKIGLQESHYKTFCEISKVVTFKKKEFLIKEGKICNFIGIVETGIIKSFMQKEGIDYNNGFYMPNQFFSAFSSFTKQRPAVSSLQAMRETRVRIISFDQLNQLYEDSALWYKFGKYIAEDFYYRKCNRETSLLQETAIERFDSFIKTHPNIEQLIPQYEIAYYLNIKPESLSRLKVLTYIK